MAGISSYDVYHEWRNKHWSRRTMHTPTKIQKAVFKRIGEANRRLIEIVDNPNKETLEKAKAFYGNGTVFDCEYEIVREAGKKVLLVWATFKP